MTSILVSAAVGLVVTLLGTPVAIRLFRAWGWGQRIREAWYGEGPEAHITPTSARSVLRPWAAS